MKNKSIIYIMLGATLILLTPLIAMQFSSEVVWTIGDFIFAWVLLVIIGLSAKLLTKNISKNKTIYFALIIPFGIFMFIFGEYDDSPGAQLIGLILTVIGVVGIVKAIRKQK